MQKDLIERKNLFDDRNGQKLKEQKKIDTINYVLLHSASRINHPHLPLRFFVNSSWNLPLSRKSINKKKAAPAIYYHCLQHILFVNLKINFIRICLHDVI